MVNPDFGSYMETFSPWGITKCMSMLGRIALGLLLFVGFSFPFALSGLKVFLLALVLVISGILVVSGRSLFGFVDARIVKVTFLIVSMNFAFVLWGGLLLSTEEAFLDSLKTYVFLPGVMFLFLIFLPVIFSYRIILWALVCSAVFVSYTVIFQALRVRGINLFGEGFFWAIYPGAQFDISDSAFTGETGYLPRSMEMLIMLAPFSAGLLVSSRRLGVNFKFAVFVYVVVAFAVFLSERRAFMLLMVLATFGCALVSWKKKRRFSSYIGILVSVMIFLAVGLYYNVIGSLGQQDWFSSVSASYDDFSDSTRVGQAIFLLEESLGSPLVGHGFGASIEDGRRESPWRFELIYVALLFQVGYLGAALYLFMFSYLLFLFYKAMKFDFYVVFPFFLAFVGVIVIASTNPYLSYGSGQARLLIPVLVLNLVLKKRALGGQNYSFG